ncbi:hypothetical protein OFAG_02215 [Oxalobacter formigenes HOxBLS]|uniref:Sel1 repeat family protein n=2 Tax=Oxalobacter paraformigenes TaxID=556268 RepID=T5LT41_9BURK|nr:hypothetical protein OFAG_02215 [Oxalobacter paraformigenes]
MAVASVWLAAGLPGLAADTAADFPARRCQDAFGCIPGESCREAKALYARARRGDREAATALGLRLMMGNGVMPDDLAAMRWFEKAAAKGDTVAQVALGAYLTRRESPEETVAQGLAYLEKAAKAGNPVASSNLAMLYRIGRRGIPENGALAEKWTRWTNRLAEERMIREIKRAVGPYRDVLSVRAGQPDDVLLAESVKAAAAGGETMAQTLYGVWLASGDMEKAGISRDLLKGADVLAGAAKSGDAVAAFALGDLLWVGTGALERNPEAAAGWLKQAAEGGHAKGMALYGFLLLNGLYAEMDPARGLAYLEEAVRQGLPEAQMALASVWMGMNEREKALRAFGNTLSCRDCTVERSILAWKYGAGNGPVTGEPENMTEIRRLAQFGDPTAMLYLGMACDVGAGGRRDACQAVRWYEKAAEKGMQAVYLPLAMACVETDDLACARKWLAAAACSAEAMGSPYHFMLAFALDEVWLDDRKEANGADRAAVSGDRVKSRAKRLRWLHQEARRGNGAAAAVLGGLYEAGIGVAKDEEQSAMWRQRAREAQACRRLPLADSPSAGGMDGSRKPEGEAR